MSNIGQSLDKKTRITIIILAIFGIFIVFAWANNFKSSLSVPFLPRGEAEVASSPVCSGGNCPGSEEENSKVADTDKDGLTNWNELNVYNTSPYLEDTDSDGIDDGLEIKNGTNPNCAGDDCAYGGIESEETEGLSETNFASTSNTDINFSAGLESGDMSEEELISILGGGGNAELLRSALITAGMDKEILDQINDEDLMQSYYNYLENYK